MLKLKLNSSISINDVSVWPSKSALVSFSTVKESGFNILADGISIAKLHQMRQGQVTWNIKSKFDFMAQSEDATTNNDNITSLDKLHFLKSIFGLELINYANSIAIKTKQIRKNHILDPFWQHVIEKKGEFTNGEAHYMVCRDPDYPIPECIPNDNARDFPVLYNFYHKLKEINTNLGLDGVGFQDSNVATFLYEAFRNSWDHARRNIYSQAVDGYRGIIYRKIIFTNEEDIIRRREVPAFLQEYFVRMVKSSPKKIFSIITVADLGPGIQNTLEPMKQRSSETPWERLNRAFRIGVSCKPPGSGIERGMGLYKLQNAAKQLDAFLFVFSAGLVGYCDYSALSKRTAASKSRIALNQFSRNIQVKTGTSITLIWPIKTND